MWSNEGKQIEKEKLNQRYRDIFLGEMMKVKDKATEAADKTIDLATKILLEDPAQPEETKVATFNQKLADLKTSLLLAPNPERGIESLKMFVEETTDPYLAKQLQSEFYEMAASIVKDGSAAEKVKLNEIYEHIKVKSMTEEQKRAETLKGLDTAGKNRVLLLKGGVDKLTKLLKRLGLLTG